MVGDKICIQYVCFIDVLGFKEFIEENEIKDPSKIISFLDDYSRVATEVPNQCFAKSSRISTLSDSLIISTDYNDGEGWPEFLDILTRTIQFFFRNDFLFRGGLTLGPLIHEIIPGKGSVLFGSGFHDAYALEGKSVYPRIVIGDKFFSENHKQNYVVDAFLDCEMPERPEHYFRKDFDGIYIFDTLRNLHLATSFFECENGIEKLESILEKGLKNKNQSVRAKYHWFLTQEFEPVLHNWKDKSGTGYYVGDALYYEYCGKYGLAFKRNLDKLL